ncbi:DNA polymerase III subunit beta [Psychrosphaera ytuae]|uniref:Beta sliding clamp n=1 Tax=Psychrosphaera ytuae TaxID=2820710 RepID=A0A975D9Y9_9GAMM|nr:DNA polymerase III subunit beta [Psychrosphaera ytuae]QTH62963.1 DNA polymerase III subunit beta [Psychrosphaera ytuae]
MHFIISKDALLKPLTMVSGAIERKHTLPILSNVLIETSLDSVRFTGTDMEVELVASATPDNVIQAGAITVPAKKLFDICRSLPGDSEIELKVEGHAAILKAGKSRFSLSTLPASDYPNLEEWQSEEQIKLQRHTLRALIERIYFSMANQDVRYYLNGMSFELESDVIRTVATDGHRLALAQQPISNGVSQQKQVIVPRKAVLEILRLVEDNDAELELQLGNNHIRINDANFVFTSKLVDGRFPDYRRVLPQGGDKTIVADKNMLKDVFQRVSILSNEKFKGVRLNLSQGELLVSANNPEQEQAEETALVDYNGGNLEIGFNVSYIIDVLNNITTDTVKIMLADANSSALIEGYDDASSLYVVMPMKL